MARPRDSATLTFSAVRRSPHQEEAHPIPTKRSTLIPPEGGPPSLHQKDDDPFPTKWPHPQPTTNSFTHQEEEEEAHLTSPGGRKPSLTYPQGDPHHVHSASHNGTHITKGTLRFSISTYGTNPPPDDHGATKRHCSSRNSTEVYTFQTPRKRSTSVQKHSKWSTPTRRI